MNKPATEKVYTVRMNRKQMSALHDAIDISSSRMLPNEKMLLEEIDSRLCQHLMVISKLGDEDDNG